MQKDLLEESFKMLQFKLISSSGHSKLNLAQMTNHSLLFNIKEKPKNSKLNKSHQWFSQRWKKLLKLTWLKQLNLLLLLYQLISVMPKDKPQRMLEPLLESTFLELSMSQLLLLLLMVSIDNKQQKRTFLSLILVEVLLMYPFLLLKKVSSKLKPQMVTLI